ncbi:hypothetical protein ACU6U9_02985 [Pseudomonas sp. HK3]
MKTGIKAALCLSLCLSMTVVADGSISYGVGIGRSYSGLGVNYGMLSETDFKYVTTGILAYSSSDGRYYASGAGWMKTNLFNSNTPNHGANIYAGIINNDKKYNNTPYIGAGYLYFFDGIKNPGKAIGVSFFNGNEIDGFGLGLSFQFEFGYQF